MYQQHGLGELLVTHSTLVLCYRNLRKGEEAEPYLNHLIEVASLVAEATEGDRDAVIAALLHDAVEDQGVSGAEIADLFGPTLASLVAGVTDDKSLPKQVRKDK